MKNQEAVKLFAFKLAEKQDKDKDGKPDVQWKVRDGVAIAGCSGDDLRVDDPTWGHDAGYWC